MDILIFSDSHGSTEGMRWALERQPTRPAAILHLGDGVRDALVLEESGIPLYTVRGNCDPFLYGLSVACPEECVLAMGGHTILMTHGARYGVKAGLGGLLAAAAQQGADIVLYGHTHQPHEEMLPAGSNVGGVILDRPMYVFNPGSIGRGEHSFGVLTMRGKDLLFSHGKL